MLERGHIYIYAEWDFACNFLRYCRRISLAAKLILLFIFAILTPVTSFGQFYEYGQDAGSLKWNQFSSSHYKLIYPRGLDSVAMGFADKLEYFYPHQAKVLDHEHRKIPVIIHNEVSFSNGVFVWAPKRLEIFTNPDPNGYPQDWLTELAIHEGRHAVQVSKLNQGFSRGLSVFGGEQVVGAITGFLPIWYLEGDAVDAETRFSYTGRGRMPSFEMGIKALLIEKKQYSFSKALLGSYKDYIPNHYELGYLLVRYGRRTHGDQLWIDMENYAARKPFLLVPTYISMRKYGVKSKAAFYRSALDEYRNHWISTLEQRNITPYRSWSTISKNYTDFRSPQWVNDSTLVALKSGMDQIPEFVLLGKNGEEKRIFRPGFLNSGRYSYRDQKLAWDEWVPSARWSNRNFSVIRLYDIETGKVRNMGTRTRYYSPSFSNGAEQVAVIEQGTDLRFYLVILDLSGKVLKRIGSPGNLFIQHPAWMEGDTKILVTLNDHEGEHLYSYSLADDQWDILFHSGFDDISSPAVRGSFIFFSGTKSGIDNIFCFDLSADSLSMVTSSKFGAFEPAVSPSGEELYYSDYHADGHRVVSTVLDWQSMGHEFGMGERVEQLDYKTSAEEKQIIDGMGAMEKGEYTPRPYRKIPHSVNIHSWLPLYFDYLNPYSALSPEELPVSLGLTLLSQNLLSTVSGMIGYEFKDQLHYIHTGVTLKGKVPVIDLRMNYGGYPDVYKYNPGDSIITIPNRITFSSSAHIPIRFNTGKYITYIQPSVDWNYTSDIFYHSSIKSYQTGSHRFNYRFYLVSYLRKGRKDIFPRIGITASASYRHAPFDEDNLGNIYSYGISAYIPGGFNHDAFKLGVSRQIQEPLRYLFGNSISLPRGMHGLTGLDMTSFSIDYAMPLLYPDLSLEGLLYLKRVRATFWGDYLVGKDMLTGDSNQPLADQTYVSYGIDLMADLHPIRLQFPFSMGARFAYLPETKELNTEFLFSISIQ